jgi:hypothetical protein
MIYFFMKEDGLKLTSLRKRLLSLHRICHFSFMLRILDILLTLLHLIIIALTYLAGYFRYQESNFTCILISAFCWFVLGIWFGWDTAHNRLNGV